MRLHEWGMDTSALRAFIAECLDLGITTFDHADIYGSYTCEGYSAGRWPPSRRCATASSW